MGSRGRFVGFLVLIIAWPLNNFAAKRAVRIRKGVSVATDKRMGVLNELITAVRPFVFRPVYGEVVEGC